MVASDANTFSIWPSRTSTTAFVQVLPWPSISRPKRIALGVSNADRSQQKKAMNRQIAIFIRTAPRHVWEAAVNIEHNLNLDEGFRRGAFKVYGGSKKPLRACTVNFLSFAFNSSL